MLGRWFLAPALLLAACGPLVQVGGNAPKPEALYTLSAEPAGSGQAAPVARGGRVVMVAAPAVTGALQTLRVPVEVGDTRLQYLTGAQWVEAPSKLLQRVVIDRMNASGLTAIGPGVNDGAQRVVASTLRRFGLDARTPGALQAGARVDAVLTDADGRLIATRSFEAVEPVASDQPQAVVQGLNRAANRLAAEITAWAGAS